MLIAGGIELPGRTLDWSQAYRQRVAAQPLAPRRSIALDQSGVTIVSSPPSEDDYSLGNTTVDAHERVVDIPHAAPSEPADVSEPTSYRRVAEPQPASSRDRELDGWPHYPLATEHEEITETKTAQTTVGEPNDGEVTNVSETTDAGEPNDAEITNIKEVIIDERPALLQPIPLAVDTEPGGPPPIDDNDLPWLEELALEPGDANDTDAPPASDSGRETSLPPAPLRAADYAAQLRGAGASEQDIEALLDWLDE
jgi:hypothetical protein